MQAYQKYGVYLRLTNGAALLASESKTFFPSILFCNYDRSYWGKQTDMVFVAASIES